MANPVLPKGYKVTTAIAIFRAVMLTADDSIKQADTAGAFCVGICQEAVDSTDGTAAKRVVDVVVEGTSKAVAGAAVATRGTALATTTTGKLIAATTGQRIVAYSLTAAAADGDWFDVLLRQGGVLA
jgi:hypothetical protein